MNTEYETINYLHQKDRQLVKAIETQTNYLDL